MKSKLVLLVFLFLLVCFFLSRSGRAGSGKDGTDRQNHDRLVSRFD